MTRRHRGGTPHARDSPSAAEPARQHSPARSQRSPPGPRPAARLTEIVIRCLTCRIEVPDDYTFWGLHVGHSGRDGLAGCTSPRVPTPRIRNSGSVSRRKTTERRRAGDTVWPTTSATAVPSPSTSTTSAIRESMRFGSKGCVPWRTASSWDAELLHRTPRSREFDPEVFDPPSVRFDDPRERWRRAFEAD